MITLCRLCWFQVCTTENKHQWLRSTQQKRHTSNLYAKIKLCEPSRQYAQPLPPSHQIITWKLRHCHYVLKVAVVWGLLTWATLCSRTLAFLEKLRRKTKRLFLSALHLIVLDAFLFQYSCGSALKLKLLRERPASGFWRVLMMVYNALSVLWYSKK
jgi:hypothetical protein